MSTFTQFPHFVCDRCRAEWVDPRADGNFRYRWSMCESCVMLAFAEVKEWARLAEGEIIAPRRAFLHHSYAKVGREDVIETGKLYRAAVRVLARTKVARDAVKRRLAGLFAQLTDLATHRSSLAVQAHGNKKDREVLLDFMEKNMLEERAIQRQVLKVKYEQSAALARPKSAKAEALAKQTDKRPFTPDQLERIKEDVPIEAILGAPLRTYGVRKSYRCPLHSERTPSFVWFDQPGKRKFHCFGCGKGGSLVDLCMALNGTDFVATVVELKKFL